MKTPVQQMPHCPSCGSRANVSKIAVENGRTSFECSSCGKVFKIKLREGDEA